MPRRRKNLLKNPCAKGLYYWKAVYDGGDGFKCEEEPIGCVKICDCTSVKENLPCWSTSSQLCEKSQLVYLPEFDISEERLDEKKPPIRIKDWYGSRVDCGSLYNLSVRLLADDKSTELDVWKYSDTKERGAGWTKVKHVFKDYPPGVRYVEFKHGGQDLNFWAGHFGAKMTNSGVFVGDSKNDRKKKKRAVREKLCKNLLKNPCAASCLEGWTIVGDGEWACEKEPIECKPIIEANEEAEGESCWATSYQDGEKKQVIDLGFEGFYPDYMDEIRPEIIFSEWFGSRSDAGCVHWLTVRLLNSDMKTLYEKVIKDTTVAEGDWHKVEGSFRGYGPGVRFIEYSHGGRGTCFLAGNYGAKIKRSFGGYGPGMRNKNSHGGRGTCSWAGNYGAKITCSFVTVVAEAEISSSSSSSSDEN
ncbi:uncharacterized protein LOC123549189 isoform X2 [Mercenaria mercenaria]|uniref:uncharacterized protein LOC123549189 isoform X2 n=1 Tax=Mercenaria mercenaria TaxID=6596 RepID=UPI00234F8A91|nr:uncharacterized protein LOC123549189 isoform X2 [Mercenaria mercenaria]